MCNYQGVVAVWHVERGTGVWQEDGGSMGTSFERGSGMPFYGCGCMNYEGYEGGVECGMWNVECGTGVGKWDGGVKYISWNGVMNAFAWLWVRVGWMFLAGVEQCTILEGWFIISKVRGNENNSYVRLAF